MADGNISFSIDDANCGSDNLDVVLQLLGSSGDFANQSGDFTTSLMLNYQLNMSVKQLLQICDYYGLAKGLKSNKSTKDEIISLLVHFEEDDNNSEVVSQRRLMWFYIEELKNNRFMKKYVFW